MKRTSFSAVVVALALLLACIPRALAPTATLATGHATPRLMLSPALLATLKARAAGADPAWTALKAKCDVWTTGVANAPTGNAYPNSPNVGQGYQGDGYLPPLYGLGLCYQVTGATSYATAGARILEAMALPASTGGQAPSTDDGYGIRNYGVGMAVGYDWLYPAMTQATRDHVIAALGSWIDWYDTSGFVRGQPIANYFVGYLLTKGATALATADDVSGPCPCADAGTSKASAYWTDVEMRLWGQLAGPAYARGLAGGGWPEGWQYGPRSVRGIGEFLWMAHTAKGLDWGGALVSDQARYLMRFSWPSLKRIDDQGTVHSGAKITPSPALLLALATMLEASGKADEGALAPTVRAFAADAITTAGDDREAWQKFLYGPATPGSYSALPLSHLAGGPGHVAAASSWARDATWVSFAAGPYLDAPDSGEQLFGQGSLSLVHGDTPLLVNATGWLPMVAGSPGEDFVYNDSWSAHPRRLYNTYFPGGGQNLNPTAATHVERFEDGMGFVRVRGAQLADVYTGVTQFTRDIVYVRPSTVVVYDRTTAASSAVDQWLAWHVPETPTAVPGGYDVGTRGGLRTVLPGGATGTLVTTLDGVVRIEVRPPARVAALDWLTVAVASSPMPAVSLVSGTGVAGVLVKAPRNQVVVFSSDHAGTGVLSSTKYTVTQTADADHMLLDVAPSSTGYAVMWSAGTVTIAQGGPFKTTAGGALAFSVKTTGVVGLASWDTGTLPPPPAPVPVVDSGCPVAAHR